MNVNASSHLVLLEAIGKLKSNEREDFKIECHGFTFKKALPTKHDHFFIRFFKWLFRCHQQSSADDLTLLKKFYERIVKDIAKSNVKNSELSQRYKTSLKVACEGLKNLYRHYQEDQSPEGMLKRNDILEALSVAHANEATLGFTVKRIKAPIRPPEKSFNPNDIPVINFADMENATETLRAAAKKSNKSITEMSLEEVHQHLGALLMKENVPMGHLLDAMYKHEILHLNVVNQFATWTMGHRHRSEKNVTPESIVSFFRRLNISVGFEWKGEMHAYSEIFKQELRNEKSNDAAFQRTLNTQFKEKLLAPAKDYQKKILETCKAGSLIISNSFNRMRIHHISKSNGTTKTGVRKKFNILGKLMNESPENAAAAKHEKSHTGRFAFSVKNMLGNEDDVKLFQELIPSRKLTKQKADKLLLDAMTQMIDCEDTTMVVQRLAPEDIHCYIKSVNGTILSRKESCRVLSELIEQQKNRHSIEYSQLIQLMEWYKSNPRSSEKPTINITGRQQGSVNPKALDKHSEILAQNDRKIMLMQHDDGSLSLHSFIGATGVNNVGVTAKSVHSALGEDVGSMGMGNEANKAGWQDGASIQINSKVKTDSRQTLGQELGAFDHKGSTIVSLYFNKNTVLIPKLDAFAHTVRYKVKELTIWQKISNAFRKCFNMPLIPVRNVSRSIEVKTSMGEVIGVPKTFVAIEAVKAYAVKGSSSSDMIHQFYESFSKRYQELRVLPSHEYIEVQDRVAAELWEILEKQKRGQSLSPEENTFFYSLKKCL